MATRDPIAVGEWYHCYNRGFEKSKVFRSSRDYERFLLGLYLCNDRKPLRVRESRGWSLLETLQNNTDRDTIVDIGAYALMLNHVHMVLREKTEGGIALFMQKLFTSYTMYINKKYDRTGSLFAGTFKSKHVSDDQYLKQVIPYVLLNPDKLSGTPYSSLEDFLGTKRPENKIVENLDSLYDKKPTLAELRKEAAMFESLRMYRG